MTVRRLIVLRQPCPQGIEMDMTYQLPTIDNRLAKNRIGVVLEHIAASAMTVVESNDLAGE